MKNKTVNEILKNAKDKELMDIIRLAYLTGKTINRHWKKFECTKNAHSGAGVLVLERSGFRMVFDKLYTLLNKIYIDSDRKPNNVTTWYNDVEVNIDFIVHACWSESRNKTIEMLVGYRISIPLKNTNQ